MRKNDLNFSFKLLKEAVNELKILLNSQQELDEKKDLQPFFRKYPVLLLAIADLGGISKTNVDELEFEFDLWQGLICDFGIGNSKTNTYCLVELEDAKRNSLFKTNPKNHPKFSDRFETGYSQIIDWFWKIDMIKNTSSEIKRRFASDNPTISAILIIGRSEFLNTDSEQSRFKWRTQKIVVDSKKIICSTYDELLEYLESEIRKIENDRAAD